MKEAIKDYKRAAKTVTTRSIDEEFEPPALLFYSNPPFKPSKSEKYKFDMPARDIFMFQQTQQRKSMKINSTTNGF